MNKRSFLCVCVDLKHLGCFLEFQSIEIIYSQKTIKTDCHLYYALRQNYSEESKEAKHGPCSSALKVKQSILIVSLCVHRKQENKHVDYRSLVYFKSLLQWIGFL